MDPLMRLNKTHQSKEIEVFKVTGWVCVCLKTSPLPRLSAHTNYVYMHGGTVTPLRSYSG